MALTSCNNYPAMWVKAKTFCELAFECYRLRRRRRLTPTMRTCIGLFAEDLVYRPAAGKSVGDTWWRLVV